MSKENKSAEEKSEKAMDVISGVLSAIDTIAATAFTVSAMFNESSGKNDDTKRIYSDDDDHSSKRHSKSPSGRYVPTRWSDEDDD